MNSVDIRTRHGNTHTVGIVRTEICRSTVCLSATENATFCHIKCLVRKFSAQYLVYGRVCFSAVRCMACIKYDGA